MRNLKKIFAIVLTVALVFSLVSVGVFADDVLSTTVTFRASTTDTATITSVKPGKTIYADVFVPAGEYKSLAVSYATAIGTLTAEDITVGVDGSGVDAFNARDKKAQAKWTSKVTIPENTPVLTIKIDVPDNQAVAENTKVLTSGAFSYNISGVTAGTAVDGSVNVVEGFVGKTAEYVGTTSFAIGTDVAAELAKGTATVKGDGNKEADKYAIKDITAPAEFDAKKPGTYAFTATVVPDESKAASWTGDLKVNINVTLTAVTDADLAAKAAEVTVMVKEDKTAFTEDQLKAEVIKDNAITATAKSDSTITDEYAITAENIAISYPEGKTEAKEDGDTATATITVSGKSNNELFDLAAATVTVAIKVVPASINDGSVAVTAPSGISTSEGSVKITVALKEAAAADGKIEVTFKKWDTKTNAYVDLEAEYTKTVDVKAGDKTVDITFDGELFDSNKFSVGDKLGAIVKYNGATVLGDGANADGIREISVVNASSGSKPSGIPSGGSSTKAQYNITVAKTENGTVSVAAKAAKGDTVTITTTADKGYKLDKIVVTTSNGTNVPVTDKTFTMPAYNVTITATFVEGEEEPVNPKPGEDTKSEFTDLPSSHWAYEAVTALKDLGIVNGVSADSFAPDNNVTRAEFTKMVAVLFGLKATSTESKFADCGADDWFTPYVLAAAEAGYVNGVDDTHFAPDAQITRQDICTILGRVLDANEAAAEAGFTDADQIQDYAVQYVKSFVALGVVNGYEDGTFRPEVSATRAEAAKILFGITKLDNEKVKNAVAALKGEVVAPAGDNTEAVDENAADDTADDTTADDDTTVDDGSAPEK